MLYCPIVQNLFELLKFNISKCYFCGHGIYFIMEGSSKFAYLVRSRTKYALFGDSTTTELISTPVAKYEIGSAVPRAPNECLS